MGERSHLKLLRPARAAGWPSRRAGDEDLGGRLRAAQPALRGMVRRRATLVDLLRGVNAAQEPRGVAEAILAHFACWVPAVSFAVVTAEGSEPPALLATRNVPPAFEPALHAVAAWALKHDGIFTTANLGADGRVGPAPALSLLALPLPGRRPLGVMIAFDDAASKRAPVLSPGVEQGLLELLEPAAAALDNVMHLQRAEALSVTDDLTRLYNSRYLHVALRREVKRAARGTRPLAVLFIDLDGFKGVNDHHGHLAGSRALVETGELLHASARETDIVARYGGDEFAIVLPDTVGAGAVLVARRLRERISSHRFLVSEGLDIHLTASVGGATFPDVAILPEDLLRAADAAMYRVKDRGKDGIEMAAPALAEE